MRELARKAFTSGTRLLLFAVRLTFVALSYCGRLNLMFGVADRNACRDLDVPVRGMNKAWQELTMIRAAA